MDKAYFRKKVDAMMPDLVAGIRKECDRLYDYGGVEPSDYGNDYILAKTILTVSIENQARQYMPLTDEGRKVVRSLRHF